MYFHHPESKYNDTLHLWQWYYATSHTILRCIFRWDTCICAYRMWYWFPSCDLLRWIICTNPVYKRRFRWNESRSKTLRELSRTLHHLFVRSGLIAVRSINCRAPCHRTVLSRMTLFHVISYQSCASKRSSSSPKWICAVFFQWHCSLSREIQCKKRRNRYV